MEFAAEGILVNQQIINLRWMSGTSSTKQLFTPIDVKIKDTPQLTYKEKKVAWEYHIAALLLPPVVPEPTIIDPALETEPVSVQKWISHANSGGIAQSVLVNQQPSLGYNSFSTFASNYVGVAPSLSSNWASVSAADFKSFPAYRFSEIKLACETLAKIYTCNGNPSDPRLKTLVERTNLLASQLKLKGLLNDWDQTEIQCAPTDSFSCFNAASEPVPPKPAPTSSIRNTLVESSCIIGQSFTLAIEVSGSRSAMSVSAFPRCEILASALDRKSFPSSQPAPPTSEGGPTVKSSCNSGSLQISISVNGSQSTSSMSVGSEAVCQEIKNLINQQKI
jgi:hypothetical protein